MLFWHLGATLAITRYTFRDESMDVRLLLLGALLPDLIDTPIAIVKYATLGEIRLIGHALLLPVVVMGVVLIVTRRGRFRRAWMPLAIGAMMHLFLDAMWANPETLLWPLLGAPSVDPAATFLEPLTQAARNPVVWLAELVGLTYLVALFRKARVVTLAGWGDFLSNGRVNVPID